MSFIATAVVASTAVSVIGQRQAAKASKAQAAYNAEVSRQEARQKELEDHENAKRARADKRKAIAQARARIAASGGVVGQGSNADLMDSLDTRLETEIQDRSRQAYIAAANLRQDAEMGIWEGKQKSAAYNLQAVGSLFDGFTSYTSLKK